MTDLDAIRRRWSTYGGMGNPRSADDSTDTGCRVLAEHAFRDVNELLPIIAGLEAQRDHCIERLNAVHALVEHARKISPSERAVLYVADVERELGMDAPTPHKLGGNDTAAQPETGE
jgi:hypothetical protein